MALPRPNGSDILTIDDSVGSKWPMDMVIDHSKLPSKKFLVSHNDKENYSVLAEAGFQPHQEQCVA